MPGARWGGSLLLAPVLSLLALVGCLPESGRSLPPALLLDPPSALQGAKNMVVNITAAGVELANCRNLTPSALVFTSAAGQSQIEVYVLDAVQDDVLRAEIVVDELATVGRHSVTYSCDDRTQLSGNFEVRAKGGEAELVLDPDEGPAGQSNVQIYINAVNATFVDGVSHVIFGDGTTVAVKEQEVVTPDLMDVTVDIAYHAPLGEMEVAVITGSQVVRGEFEVTQRIYPTIQVYPDQIERPQSVEPPAQASLWIQGNGVHFVAPDEVDGGPEEGTQVSFPLNPGVDVTSIDVTTSVDIEVNILVDHVALLGPTPLRVATGEEVAETDFTVLPAEDEPVLLLSPNELPRGITAALVLAQAANFTFDAPLTVEFTDAQCTIENYEVLPPADAPKSMALMVSIDPEFTGDGTVLEVTSGTGTAAAHLAVSDDLGPVLETFPIAPAIEQGATEIMLLTIQGDVFDPAAEVEVLERSGLRIILQSVDAEGESITIQLRAAKDAPVGPALLTVLSAEHVLHTSIEVVPSGLVPFVALTPKVVLPGRRTVEMSFVTDGIDLSSTAPVIRFDDPAVTVQEVTLSDATHAAVEVAVAPTARSDMTVAYLEGDGGRAAATFRGINAVRPIAEATPSELTRGAPGPHIVVVELAEGTGEFGNTVAQVLDGIGLEVERVTYLDEQSLELEFELTDGGPGGLVGVLLTTGPQQAIVPIRLIGEDESLTLGLTPDEIEPGARGVQIQANAPSAAEFDPVFTAASAGLSGAYATLEELVTDSQATVLVDVAFDAQIPEEGIPIFLTTSKGAVAGFLLSESLASGAEPVSDDSPLTVTLEDGEVRVVRIEAEGLPALVGLSQSEPDHADIHGELLAPTPEWNGDPGGALVTDDATQLGRVWLWDQAEAVMAIAPVSDPGGQPSTVRVSSKAAGALLLTEPDDLLAQATEITADPCDAPVLASGAIAAALDVERIELSDTSCRLTAAPISRVAADRPWSAPDLWVELRDAADLTLVTNNGWPTDADDDPRIYFDAGSAGRQIVWGAELGTAGPYLLNLRRPATVREICAVADAPFVELELEPGASFDTLSLELVDAETGIVLAGLSLVGQPITNDGAIVISGAEMAEADLQSQPVAVFPDGPFAVRLLDSGEVIDAVEVGGDGDYGEGDPLDSATGECFQRFAGVDSDDNLFDFTAGWVATPGY